MAFHRALFLASLAAAILLLAAHSPGASAVQRQGGSWPQRVLITNDDGIDDPKVWALARAFASRGDTWLVAANRDRSSTSNVLSLGEDKRALTVRRVFHGKRLAAFAVGGYPADCVAFGVLGLLKDDPPDLVVSGVNGGPNLGVRDWFGSGTIGAARTAALLGIPAIAVSGLDDNDRQMVAKVTQWILNLAASPIVRDLKPGQYLTIAIPRVPADRIRGVRIAPRMPMTTHLFELDRIFQGKDDDKPWEVWLAKPTGRAPVTTPGSDAALYRQGYIVITPMRIGEVDDTKIPLLRQRLDNLPKWSNP